MRELLENLKNDHQHGSKDIANRFLLDCRDYCAHNTVAPADYANFLEQAGAARPSMVILQNITRRLREVISKSSVNLRKEIIDSIDLLLKEMQVSDQLILERTKTLCRELHIRSVLTHSRSSTVEYVLRGLGKSGKLSSLICTESRPLNEGVALANALSSAINTSIIVDTLADQVMPQCDCVILGADAIDRHGNIVNKIGSRLLALSAKDHSVPVICLAESLKTLAESDIESLPGESHCAAELGHLLNSNVSVTNQYFEVVENKLLAKIISDQPY